MVALYLGGLAAIPCVLIALVILVLAAVARARARRRADADRTALEELAQDGTTLVVRGKLVIDGVVRDRTLGPADLGATTVWSSARSFGRGDARPGACERAPVLEVHAGAQRYVLEGPVQVVAGSLLRWTGQRDYAKAFLGIAAVRPGDEVVVAGAPRRAAPAEARGYRDEPSTILGPMPAHGVVRLAAVAPPVTSASRRLWSRHPIVWLAVCIGVIPLASAVRDRARPSCAKSCSQAGLCTKTPTLAFEPLAQALKHLVRGEHFVCTATRDAECRDSAACELLGRCTAVNGECRAARPEDCRYSTACLDVGACTPIDGACVVASREDCKYTSICAITGACSPREKPSRACEVAGDDDCAETLDCGLYGRCRATSAHECVERDEDCRDQHDCRVSGRCSLDPANGLCRAAKPMDCRATDGCRENGKCSPVNGSCAVATDDDCRQSEACAEDARCRADSSAIRGCEVQGPCGESDACRIHGRCGVEGFSCIARSDADCAKSDDCKEHGACKALDGECAASCADTTMCRKLGACTLESGHCVVGGNDDCKRSEGCRVSGMCHAAPSGTGSQRTCVVGRDEDCRSSAECLEEGACTKQDNRCVLASAADCERTRSCTERHWGCSLDERQHRCVPSSADCRAQPACKRLGLCTLGLDQCMVGGDEDCKQSEVCARFGWCSRHFEEAGVATCFHTAYAPVAK